MSTTKQSIRLPLTERLRQARSTSIDIESEGVQMGLFDMFRKRQGKRENGAMTIGDLMGSPYVMSYEDECKEIWRRYVPARGQSSALQGEVLRRIEALRIEAQDNGNINWDENFSRFCMFIPEVLEESGMITSQELAETTTICEYLKDCGEYASQVHAGTIPDDQADMERVAYVEDGLFDRLADLIGKLQAQHPDPIEYDADFEVDR